MVWSSILANTPRSFLRGYLGNISMHDGQSEGDILVQDRPAFAWLASFNSGVRSRTRSAVAHLHVGSSLCLPC